MLKKINIITYIIMLVSLIILIVNILRLAILPNNYLLLIIGVVIFLIIILGLLTFLTKNKVIKIILIILTLIISSGGVFASDKIFRTNKFLSGIKEVDETSIYYVVVSKNSKYSDISDLNDKNIGTCDLAFDNYDMANDELNKVIKYNNIKYTNILKLSTDLLDNKIDAIYINSNIKYLLEEEGNLKDKIRVIKKTQVKVESSVTSKVVESDETFSIYISGIDTAGDINTVSRSDVNIIMTINPRENKILLTTIPRDSYVQLHGISGSKDKLTHAGIYGINMSKATIEDFLDIEIDYYVRINFDTLVKVIDAIGGVNVVSDVAFKASGYTFIEGNNEMDGKKALAFSRARKQFAEGDRLRGQHQQAVITAIIDKVTSSKTLLTNYNDVLTSLNGSFQSDIPNSIIRDFFKKQLGEMKRWEVKSISVNGTGTYSTSTYSMPGWNLYVMIPEESTVKYAHDLITAMEN